MDGSDSTYLVKYLYYLCIPVSTILSWKVRPYGRSGGVSHHYYVFSNGVWNYHSLMQTFLITFLHNIYATIIAYWFCFPFLINWHRLFVLIWSLLLIQISWVYLFIFFIFLSQFVYDFAPFITSSFSLFSLHFLE